MNNPSQIPFVSLLDKQINDVFMRCRAVGCIQKHTAHACKLCGDKDADHLSQFCSKFCSTELKDIIKCKAVGCRNLKCLSHVCETCGTKDATHVSENCPNKPLPNVKTCNVSGCNSTHTHHTCRICCHNKEDADHRSFHCPQGTLYYHQTKKSSAALILSGRYMKPGTDGACGPGIYFARSATDTCGKAHQAGYMIVAKVYMGKQLRIENDRNNNSGNRGVTPESVQRKGFDSVYYVRHPKPHKPEKDEFIIYDWKNASIVSIYPCDKTGQHVAQFVSYAATIVLTNINQSIQWDSLLAPAEFVYRNYLKNPYKDAPEKVFKAEGKTIYRPNHAIAHAIRVTFYVPFVVHVANLQLQASEILKVQIATLFYITGRESECSFTNDKERSMKYRTQSANNFEAYAKSVQIYSEDEIVRYKRALKNPYDWTQNNNQDPAKLAMGMAHELDVLRCRTEAEYDHGLESNIKTLWHTSKKGLTNEKVAFLKNLALHAIQCTGEKLYRQKRIDHLFIAANSSVKGCFDILKNINL